MIDQDEGRKAVHDRETMAPTRPATTKEPVGGVDIPKGTSSPSTIAAHHGTTPFAFMSRFAEDMDRLFEDFQSRHGPSMPSLLGRGRELFRREAGLVPADWSPQVDVKERDGTLIVRADLPGMSKDDVQVEVRDGTGRSRSGASATGRRNWNERAAITTSAATAASPARSRYQKGSTWGRPARPCATACWRSRSPSSTRRTGWAIASRSVPERRREKSGRSNPRDCS
jgi:HSP20 family molecular chaperone IbpA